MNFKRIILSLSLLSTPLLISGGVYVSRSNVQQTPPSPHWNKLEEQIQSQMDRFPGTVGILIKDLRTGWTIQHNPSKLFPSASLVKIPLMAAFYHEQANGRVSLDQLLPIERKFKVGGSGKLKFKKSGTRIPIRQLIYRMITESDNTATNVLADFFGLDYYNSYFMSLGLTHTNFSRMVMDLKKRDQGIENYTTAQDMAKLLEMIYARKLNGSEEMLEILKNQKINDRLALMIPHHWEIGHKTGLMNHICHDVGIVFTPTNDYLICILTSEVRNLKKAKMFISKISHLTTLYYSDPSLQTPIVEEPFWSKILGKIRLG